MWFCLEQLMLCIICTQDIKCLAYELKKVTRNILVVASEELS